MPAPLPSAWRGKYELSPDSPTLGGGAFAEVFKVRHRETHDCFAVKVMHRPNYALRGIEKQIGAEILAMRLAAEAAEEGKSEGHIVQLLDAVEEYDYVFLLLELCEQGDLLRMLHMNLHSAFVKRWVHGGQGSCCWDFARCIPWAFSTETSSWTTFFALTGTS